MPDSLLSPGDAAALAAKYRRSERKSNFFQLIVFLAVAGVVAVGVTVAMSQTEQTRECTLEAIQKVHVRRAPDYRLLKTTECGDIRTRTAAIRVLDRDCFWNSIAIGSTYRMTTIGIQFPFGGLQQRLTTNTVELVHAPPGATCSSDAWYIED